MTVAEMVTALSTIVPFAQDAWVDEHGNISDEYGVVELSGSPEAIWADDEMVEQFFSGNIYLYVTDSVTTKPVQVQNKLTELGLCWKLTKVEFLQNPICKRWTWSFETDGVM